MAQQADSFGTRTTLSSGGKEYQIFSLAKLAEDPARAERLKRLPVSLKILLENLLRQDDGEEIDRVSVEAVLNWNPTAVPDTEIAYAPARTLLQDFTGVPCVVDLAAMREAVQRLGGNPDKINPLERVDLVIDHSVQVDAFGSRTAILDNVKLDYERNTERYTFLRWGAGAFNNFNVVPPDTGICHQVNLEYLASVVFTKEVDGKLQAYPDTLVGTDSHTPMVNALGVLGWGVGGIEAEAAMLGQPISMLIPQVVGVKLTGKLAPGATATDLVLTVTQLLRKKNVVGKFVEYYGEGLSSLSVADRATLANMSPEYGATMGFFPVDAATLEYLRLTGRPEEQIALVEAYCRLQGLFRDNTTVDPVFSDTLELDLSTVEPSISGPRRPQDRIALKDAKPAFRKAMVEFLEQGKALPPQAEVDQWLNNTPPQNGKSSESFHKRVHVDRDGVDFEVGHGSVVLAAITSCTNTSNPSVLVGAGLLAKKAAERGIKSKPWVKTSFAPGSKVAREFLQAANLMKPLEDLGFHIVGYGCTTCIGNSGPLPEDVANAVTQGDLVAAAVLSGNRNFEGRINPLVRANYLASPPLVVAYALAGSMDLDLMNDPIGTDGEGKPVYLQEIWPTPEEVQEAVASAVKREQFEEIYGEVFKGDDTWRQLPVPHGNRFAWEDESTYIKEPPYFEGMGLEAGTPGDLLGGRVLAVLGDSVTTDHISPAGSIAVKSPAGQYLIEKGVSPKDFNSYGARRGNHEVMMRGTFANIRLRNQLAPGTEGGVTIHQPSGELMSIYDAAMRYKAAGIPQVVIAGKEYGSGSSRDWAAKGPALQGVKAVIAESYERIHRSNLVGMGILPLQFEAGQNRTTLGLTGTEVYDITGISEGMTTGKKLTVRATAQDGSKVTEFSVLARIDTPNEVEYYRHGGILQFVLRQLVSGKATA